MTEVLSGAAFKEQVRVDKLIAAARKNDVVLGLFLFGTARVGEFLGKGFPFVSVGNDLHHICCNHS